MIRTGELTGSAPIQHALQLEIWMEAYGYYSNSRPGYRWPASQADSGANKNYCSLDPCKSHPNPSLVEGSLMAIPSSINVNSLGLQTSAAKKMFAALQNYGGYLVDDTGWNDFQIGVDQGVEQEFQHTYGYSFGWGTFHDDVNKLFQALHVVNNNAPNAIGGGGTMRAPLAPPFADQVKNSSTALSRAGWKATASSTSKCCADAPNNALDGNPNTRWSTGHAQSQTANDWFEIDMGRQQSFSKIVIDSSGSPNDYPRGYHVFVSNDGGNWGKAFVSSTGTNAITSISFTTQNARYLKIVRTGNSGGWWWSIQELNLYP